jgi:hypothetical protein
MGKVNDQFHANGKQDCLDYSNRLYVKVLKISFLLMKFFNLSMNMEDLYNNLPR